MSNALTPGKLLLFGEYTVLLGGKALAFPLTQFYGQWSVTKATAQYDLAPFAAHLAHLNQTGQLIASLDTERFVDEVSNGLSFQSNIPFGYGAGSSGALCAAVYERYATTIFDKKEQQSLAHLQQQLAQIEGFFHGESSGADPLICYLKQPVLIDQKTILPVDLPAVQANKGSFFLIDTGISRRTAPLVQRFKARCEDPAYHQLAVEQLVQPANTAIEAYLQGHTDIMVKSVKAISSAQLSLLSDFIPDAFHSLWTEGINAGTFYLKLCGAGGGGFIIGYSHDGRLSDKLPKAKVHLLEI